MAEYNTKVLIIGSGPAGYSAAIYVARSNIDPILVTGSEVGGQLTTTTDVENYPGFIEPILGPQLMDQMQKQSLKYNTKIINSYIKKLTIPTQSFSKFIAIDSNQDKFIADSVIICTGSQAKWLGLKNEEKFKGYGVSGCATCDGFFFREQNVIVVGGGNTAAEEALYLTNHAKKVIVIHRRNKLRAEQILQEKLMKNNKIDFIWDSVLEDIIGDEDPKEVKSAKIRNLKTNVTKTIDISGIFIAIGHNPNTDLFKDYLNLNKEGYILTEPDSTKTNIPGLFAAGDVQDPLYRQAVTAAGTGCMAALEAFSYLEK